MKIEKGKKYLCIEDVVMSYGEIAFYKGKIYSCNKDDYFVNELEGIDHFWNDGGMVELHFEEVFIPEWGEEIEVSHNRITWVKGIFVGIDPLNKEGYVYLLKNGSAVGYFGVAPYCRPQYRELTKQEIADKFEIPLDKLKIVD